MSMVKCLLWPTAALSLPTIDLGLDFGPQRETKTTFPFLGLCGLCFQEAVTWVDPRPETARWTLVPGTWL